MMARFALLTTCMFLLASCAAEDPAATQARAQEKFEQRPVAAVNGERIRTENVQRGLAELPSFLRQSFAGETGLRGFRTGMVEFELLLQKARELGFASDPDVLVASREGLAAVLWEEVDAEVAIPAGDEVRAFYEENRERYLSESRVTVDVIRRREFGYAEQIRGVFDITRDVFSRMSRRALEERAIFLQIAGLASELEEHTLGPMAESDADIIAPRPVVEAALALEAPGDLSDLVITHDGVYLLRLVAREDRQQLPFDAVQAEVRKDALEARRVEHRRELVRKLRAQSTVEILEPPSPRP